MKSPLLAASIGLALILTPLAAAAPAAALAPEPLTSLAFADDELPSAGVTTVLLNGSTSTVVDVSNSCLRVYFAGVLQDQINYFGVMSTTGYTGRGVNSNQTAIDQTYEFRYFARPCADIGDNPPTLSASLIVHPALTFSRQGFNSGDVADGSHVFFSVSPDEGELGLADFEVRPHAECTTAIFPGSAALNTQLPAGLTLTGGAGTLGDLGISGVAGQVGEYSVCIRARSTDSGYYYGFFPLSVKRPILAETGTDAATTILFTSIAGGLIVAGGALLVLRRRKAKALDN